MHSIMKTKHDNDVTDRKCVIDHKCVISLEYKTEQSISSEQCATYDEYETRQQCDQSYKSTLCRKWN